MVGFKVPQNKKQDGKRLPPSRKRSSSMARKPTNIIIGKKVVDGQLSMRGADLTTNRYVGNINVNASSEDVRTSITSQGVDVVELEELPLRHTRWKSFRLRIKKSDISKIEEAEFWPEGIIVREFFRGKRHDAPARVSNKDATVVSPLISARV